MIEIASHADQVPQGQYADERWKGLDRDRRTALIRGREPQDQEEAFTALGYGRRMVSRAETFAMMGAIGAFVVYLAIALLADTITTQTLILAVGTGVGAGVALEIAGRWQGRRLARNAEEALDDQGFR